MVGYVNYDGALSHCIDCKPQIFFDWCLSFNSCTMFGSVSTWRRLYSKSSWLLSRINPLAPLFSARVLSTPNSRLRVAQLPLLFWWEGPDDGGSQRTLGQKIRFPNTSVNPTVRINPFVLVPPVDCHHVYSRLVLLIPNSNRPARDCDRENLEAER